MSINTILSRVLPPIIVDASIQPPPYSTFGPSAEHPHLDIHASESLCWGYTIFIVCAQLVAFGRVSERRGKQKELATIKKAREQPDHTSRESRSLKLPNGDKGKGVGVSKKEDADSEQGGYSSCAESDLDSRHTDRSDESYGTTDSEIIP